MVAIFALSMYRYVSIYQQIRIEHSWFHDNHYSFTEYKYLTHIVYSSIHIIIYFHCFIFLNQCNLLSVIATFHNIMSTMMIILYYTLPSKKNYKYDLYSYGYLFNILTVLQTILFTYFISYKYYLRDNINDTFHSIISHSAKFSIIIGHIGAQTLSSHRKSIGFKNKVKHNQHICESWWEYILFDVNNCQRFQILLMNLKIYQNILFLIEINQIKMQYQRNWN